MLSKSMSLLTRSKRHCRERIARVSIRLMLVDDHDVVRTGLKMYLSGAEGIDVVGEADNGQSAIDLAVALKPDVILMDLRMPGMDGIAALTEIRQRVPETEVIVLTSLLDEPMVLNAIRAGAIGYLLKDTRADELKRAVGAAAAGQVQLSPQAASFLMSQVRVGEIQDALTDREREVLIMVARGHSNREIASQLGIGDGTIKVHVSRILNKLGLHSRTQAALHAIKQGWVNAADLQ